MKNPLLYLSILLLTTAAFSQETDFYDYEIELGHDNDFLIIYTGTDRGYTYGINGAFRWRNRKETFITKLFKKSRASYSEINLNIEAYTPDYLSDGSPDTNEERPYAGWSYANFTTALAFKKSFLHLGLDVGVLGPSSQADDIQNWFHREITDDVELQGWENQIPDQLGINLRANYGFDLKHTKLLDIYGTINSSIGNIDTYVKPAIHFRFGKFEPIQYSVGQDNQLLGKRKQVEYYLDTGFGAKFSIYDATVQGNIFDNSLFEQDEINNILFNGYFGFCVLKNGTSIEFKYHLTTGELNSGDTHRYATLSFAQRF